MADREGWSLRHDEFRAHPNSLVGIDLLLEILLTTLAELDTKLTAVQQALDVLAAETAERS